MVSFLESVARNIYDNYHSDMHELCIVFPNLRAGVYFNKYLGQMIKKPVWGPQIHSISDLMQELSSLRLADPLTLMFLLYQVYSKESKTTETFDEFYYWGEMLLNDFDDIDKYLADPKQVFQNLADIKEIEIQFPIPEEQLQIIKEFWTNFKSKDTSTIKENFISIWQKLQIIYEGYSQILQKEKIGYEGLLCREAITKIKNEDKLKFPYKHFLIVGFNALNECEKELFKHLKKNNLADFYWDYDNYYVTNKWHEAGHFMRQNLQLFPPPYNFTSPSSLTSLQNIQIVSVPSDTGQTKMVPFFLERWGCSLDKMTDTAIVLADEQLLVPLLSCLPQNISNVNITLGYPLKFTPVVSFFEALVTMLHNVKQENHSVSFYHRDVEILLNHPYIQKICPKEANDLLLKITRFNLIFISENQFHTQDYLKDLFRVCPTSQEFISYLIDIGSHTLQLLKSNIPDKSSKSFDLDYWFIFISAVQRLQEILFKEKMSLAIPTLIKILRKVITGLTIPFKGEPLAGLQIMGVLETRALDFKNIILLSVNEGVMPKTESAPSFIPYNLRKGFGLPTIEHQDSVYAYYFYCLMQRSQNIALVYNTQSGYHSGEMSRFINQIKFDPAFNVNEQGLSFSISLSEEKDIVIPKTREIMESLNQYLSDNGKDQTLTPTALNAYLECTLRFYFRYVAHIFQKDQVSENIEGPMFGKLLHYAIQQVYIGLLGNTVYEIDLEKIINDDKFLESCILKAFAVEFFRKPNQIPRLYGNSLLVKEVLLKYIRQIMTIDKKFVPFTLMEFEKIVKTTIAVDIENHGAIINIGGKIDRVDKINEGFRVIDYKTGKINNTIHSVEQLFEVAGNKQNKDALQILLYAYVLGENPKYGHLPVYAAIYGLRDIFKENFDPWIYQSKKETVLTIDQIRTKYMEGLKRLLTEIFNEEIPFVKVTDKKKCTYCEFTKICHR